MIVTLSPAKILDFESPVPTTIGYSPIFEKSANELNELLKKESVEDLMKLMKINPPLAQSTYEYIHSFDMSKTPERQAVSVYNGIAFQGLDAPTLTEDDLMFAQKHLIILSGMYGMLHPLDKVKPYRLEMQTKLANSRGKNLYYYWSDTITDKMKEVMADNDNVWINLASNEYSKVINRKKLPKGSRIITPVFKETSGDTYKQVTVHAKKARGMMARFIIQHRIEDPEHIKAFDTEGYGYSEQLSSDDEWVFIR